MITVPPPASAAEAMDMVRAGLGYLAAADPTAMAAETQARCLQALEQAHAMGTAARTAILGAFTAGQGYSADGDYSPRAWLINRTRVTKGAAVGYTAWVRRAAAHPEIAAVLAAGEMPESFARTICAWTDKLPEECRADADGILLGAAGTGMGLADLAGLAGEIYARSLAGNPGGDEDEAFEDRSVRLETTFGGAGVLQGDLTPECAAVVGAVLEALSAPAGAEDTRSRAQRCHDGLQEAMRSLKFCIVICLTSMLSRASPDQNTKIFRRDSGHARLPMTACRAGQPRIRGGRGACRRSDRSIRSCFTFQHAIRLS